MNTKRGETMTEEKRKYAAHKANSLHAYLLSRNFQCRAIRELPNGFQIRLATRQVVNVFSTGTVLVQGSDFDELKSAIDDFHRSLA